MPQNAMSAPLSKTHFIMIHPQTQTPYPTISTATLVILYVQAANLVTHVLVLVASYQHSGGGSSPPLCSVLSL